MTEVWFPENDFGLYQLPRTGVQVLPLTGLILKNLLVNNN